MSLLRTSTRSSATQPAHRRANPNPPPPSFPRKREPIPDRVRHHDTGSSPSRPPTQSGGESRPTQIPHPRRSREGGNPSPTGCTTMTPESVRHAPRPNQVGNLGQPKCPHLRRSREGGNPSPTGCATMTPEAVRHAPRPNQVGNLGQPKSPTSVVPARREPIPDRVRHYDTGSSPSRPPTQSGGESRPTQIPHLRRSREGGNPSPTGCTTMTPEAVRHAPRPNQVGNLGQPKSPTSVVPAKAGTHPRQGAPL